MSRKRYTGIDKTESVYVKELKPKNSAQQYYMDMIRESTVTFGLGPAGTGKTYVAVAMALEALLAKEVDKVILTRPIVATEDIGYLPGDMNDKIHPYIMPLFDAIEDHLGPTKSKDLLATGRIEVIPLAFMRGRSINRCVTGDSLVTLADDSQISMIDLLTRYNNGEKITVKSYNTDSLSIEDSDISYAFKQPSNGKLLKLTLEDGTVLKVTKDHELYVDGKGKVEAQYINQGTSLLKKTNTAIGIKDITVISIEEIDAEDVYDITVPGNHNFFLNDVLSSNCFILFDESQNSTVSQMKMFLTRLGYNSKMVITGDVRQSDLELRPGELNGLVWASQRLRNTSNEIAITEFEGRHIVRNPLIEKMLSYLEGPGLPTYESVGTVPRASLRSQ